MATAKVIQQVEINPGDGDHIVGSATTMLEYTVTGDVYDVTTTVADDYTKVTMWTSTGGSNVADFDIAIIDTNADIVVQLKTATDTIAYNVTVDATSSKGRLILTADDILCQDDDVTPAVLLAAGSSSTLLAVTSIIVKNNAADAAGDATVRLVLIT